MMVFDARPPRTLWCQAASAAARQWLCMRRMRRRRPPVSYRERSGESSRPRCAGLHLLRSNHRQWQRLFVDRQQWGGGGGSLRWLHNFSPDTLIGLGAEHQVLSVSRWTFGS